MHIFPGFSKVLLAKICDCAVAIGKCIARIYFEGFVKVSNGFSKISLASVSNAAVAIGICMVRIYFNGLGIVIFSPFYLILLQNKTLRK